MDKDSKMAEAIDEASKEAEATTLEPIFKAIVTTVDIKVIEGQSVTTFILTSDHPTGVPRGQIFNALGSNQPIQH
jgi:hypothetical protein